VLSKVNVSETGAVRSVAAYAPVKQAVKKKKERTNVSKMYVSTRTATAPDKMGQLLGAQPSWW